MVDRLAEREVVSIIAEMDLETFVGFHKELHFALVYWRTALQSTNVSLIDAQVEDMRLSEAALNVVLSGRNRKDAIVNSPLYDAARSRIRKELNKAGTVTQLPKDFTGWFGLEDEDKKAIEKAIQTITNSNMPIPGLLFGAVSNEDLDTARQTIAGYGIHGVFAENPDLIATCNKYWDPTVTL